MGSMPKTKKKSFPKSIHEMSKETLQETLKKKKECNAKALLIVEKLCETNIDEDWFLANLQHINQCHFSDVIIERAITKICGYPLCDQKLDKVPAQQFHISTRYNKVFDITERKNFCSGTCYKSATYVKNQLFTSPLWFRDQEVIPKYVILKDIKSSSDEKIVLSPDKVEVEPNDIKKTNTEDKTIDIRKTIKEVEEKCENLKLDNSKELLNDKTEITVSDWQSKGVSVNEEANSSFNNESSLMPKQDEHIQHCPRDSSTSEGKTLKNLNDSKLEKTEKMKPTVKIQEESDNIVAKVEKYIFEWFSVDTLFYLYGEEKLKEMFQEKSVKIKEILNSKLSVAGYNEKIDNIIKLYGLLDADFHHTNEIKTNLKPLPDYSLLKEEGKTLEIKVRAFYQGQLEVSPAKREEQKKEEESKTDSNPIYLPLIDAHAQTALRRKIVLDKLNRVLPELIRVFSSDYILHMNDVRNLVATFNLNAHNIIFKPKEWYLVGVIIIKLLSLKVKQLALLMNSKPAASHVLLILMSYELTSDYLDNLLQRLTNSANVMKIIEINK